MNWCKKYFIEVLQESFKSYLFYKNLYWLAEKNIFYNNCYFAHFAFVQVIKKILKITDLRI